MKATPFSSVLFAQTQVQIYTRSLHVPHGTPARQLLIPDSGALHRVAKLRGGIGACELVGPKRGWVLSKV